jgi:hypothetical protein
MTVPKFPFPERKKPVRKPIIPSDFLPRLNELKREYYARKYPAMMSSKGAYAKKYADNSANGLTKCIVDYLTLIGGYATRQQSMGVKRKVGGGKEIWTKGTVKKGAADINAMFQGRSLQVEVKYGKDRMSADQHATAEHIKRAGGIYLVARTFDHFIIQFKETYNLQEHELFNLCDSDDLAL